MFNNGGSGVIPVMNVDGNRNGGWGDDWAWIILFALFGWGGNGWGGAGGNQASFTDAALQRGFDNQAVISKLDGLTNGLCDSTYALNNSIQQGNFGLQTAIMQGFNATQAQLAQCCCENREAIAQVRYDMATDTCAITTALERGFNSVNQNINDQFCQSQMREMQARIDEQQSLINALNLAQSQANQNQYLISQLRGCGCNSCSCNSGCGC